MQYVKYRLYTVCLQYQAANPGGMGRFIPPPPIFDLHPPNNFDFCPLLSMPQYFSAMAPTENILGGVRCKVG